MGNLMCPICLKSRGAGKERRLYDMTVCQKCWRRFTNRRQMAFVFDFLILCFALNYLIEMLMQVGATEGVFRATVLVLCAFFSLKDSVRGRSPGKAVFGLRVIDARSLKPIGVYGSIVRNLPILLLFLIWTNLPAYLVTLLTGVWNDIPALDWMKEWLAGFASISGGLAFLGLLAMGEQLMRGPRWGDGWAHSQVVWEPYRRQAPFEPSGRIGETTLTI